MSRLRPPIVPDQPVPVLSDDDLRALLASCSGKNFEDRRNTAIIRLLVDTGMRRDELVGLRVADVDVVGRVAVVLGKGRRERGCPFGDKTALDLDRYLRLRRTLPLAASEQLWLARKGRLSGSGLGQMLQRRGRAAGLGCVHPHQLRHTFAHAWLAGRLSRVVAGVLREGAEASVDPRSRPGGRARRRPHESPEWDASAF